MTATTFSAQVRFVVLCTLACLALTLCFFTPRLWLMRKELPGTFQWDRARTYLRQCEDPFRKDIEPAMLWRLLPPVVAHTLGLRGYAAFALPWLGIVVVTAYIVILARRRNENPRFVYGTTLLFTASSAVLPPAHWLGLNDAWAWLGLLAVGFGQARWALPVAVLVVPWVDERFIIGLPLAILVRALDRGEPLGFALLRPVLWLLPYLATRLAFSGDSSVAEPTRDFLRYHFQQMAVIAPWAPLGWWMAWRAAWLPIAYAIRRAPGWLAPGVAGTLLLCMALAADLSRSAAVLAPVMLLGVFDYARRDPVAAVRFVLLVALLNLLIPAAHITFTKFDLINPLPFELLRLVRIPAG